MKNVLRNCLYTLDIDGPKYFVYELIFLCLMTLRISPEIYLNVKSESGDLRIYRVYPNRSTVCRNITF